MFGYVRRLISLGATAVPKSKVRKEAAVKKAAKDKSQTDKRRSEVAAKARLAAGTRDWVPWVFVPLAILGVIWLLLFYIAGSRIPGIQSLHNWNYLIGIGLIAVSFGVATLWK